MLQSSSMKNDFHIFRSFFQPLLIPNISNKKSEITIFFQLLLQIEQSVLVVAENPNYFWIKF